MTLFRLYSKNDITFKKCSTKAPMTPLKKHQVKMEQISSIDKLLKYKTEGRTIIYLDETNFTPRKHYRSSFAKKY
jgi:hypothetical protein